MKHSKHLEITKIHFTYLEMNDPIAELFARSWSQFTPHTRQLAVV